MRWQSWILIVATTLLTGACGAVLFVPAVGELYVSNLSGASVTVYAVGANGNAAPIRTISGAATGLNAPRGLTLDGAGNLYVANNLNNSVTVYASGASGNAAPLRTIIGALTGLNAPLGVAVR